MGRPGRMLLAAALAGLPATALAQDRAPAERQALVDLANVLGESHALRQACEGKDDYLWYDQMKQLLAVEAPDQGLNTRLVLSFNTGFQAGQASFPVCDKANRAESARLARKGKALAERLSAP